MAQIERKVTFDADGSPSPRVLAAGMQGDNHARLIRFAAPEITEGQRVYVVVEAGKNQDKIRLYQDDDGLWGWTISRTAMAIFGNGHAQLQVVDQADPLDIKWQSGRIVLSIGASMDVDADLSIKYPTLIEQMQADMLAAEKVTEGFAMAAAQSAAEALDSAGDAESSAQAAQQSEEEAARSAQDAHGSSENAAASAQAAAASQNAAAASQDAAKASEDAAAQSAADAAKSAEEAAQIVTGDLDTRYLQKRQYTADDVLDKIKSVDGPNSGLDADTLDGHNGSYFAAADAVNTALQQIQQQQTQVDETQNAAVEALTQAVNTNAQQQAQKDEEQNTAINGKAPLNHTQAAETITAGTLAGQVKANATAIATLTTGQLRNIFIATSAPTTGVSNGDIWLMYS